MRIPISFVRALTENASTPAMPTAAISTASPPNDDTSAALRRRGATLWSRICDTVSTFSIGSDGATLRTTRVVAGTSPTASRSARITRPPVKATSWAKGRNMTGPVSASSPPSFVSPTIPTTVRQSPLTGMKRSTSPVQATRWLIGSVSPKSRFASVSLRMTTRAALSRSVLVNSRPFFSGMPAARKYSGLAVRNSARGIGSPGASGRCSAFTSSWKPAARSGIVDPSPTSVTPGSAPISSFMRS